MRHRWCIGLLSACLISVAVPALPAAAATLAGVTFPNTLDVQGHTLVLNGVGLRTKFFFKIYVGGLYLPHRTDSPAAILHADEPREMISRFLWDVSKDQICSAWRDGLRDNVPDASPEVHQNFNQLCTWMEPMGKGGSLQLTYLPGQGTRVEVNGSPKGTLPGKATADAILSLWIGPKPGPGSSKFKSGLLGGD
ncbi:MAG TPA: chalcone isomerase family protein [Vicinamibacterales bacterium]|nr:chalcone isomerase family protein [Vicinamibacterales bacterium]